jgi:hypothetical protein
VAKQNGFDLKEDIRKMRAVELVFRNMILHFPSILVFRDGKIVSPLLPGIESEKAYRDFVRVHLKR